MTIRDVLRDAGAALSAGAFIYSLMIWGPYVTAHVPH